MANSLKQPPVNKSSNWLKGLPRPTGRHPSSPIVGVMQARGIPRTRENYLKLAYPEGAPDQLPAEVEASLPREVRYTHRRRDQQTSLRQNGAKGELPPANS